MSRSMSIVVLTSLTFLLVACASAPSAVREQGPRVIVLDGSQVYEELLGKFVSWVCRDYVYGGPVLLEFGVFTDPGLSEVGFVLFDGSYSGKSTNYGREGINHRWEWGPNETEYTFTLAPDGVGRYYNFSNTLKGQSVKAEEVYRCSRR